MKGNEFYDAGKIAFEEVVIDIINDLIHIRFVPRKVAHFLGYTSQYVYISFAGAAAEFLYFVVSEEVFQIVGKVEIVFVESQFRMEIECVLGCEIALEYVHRAFQFVLAFLA